MEEAAGDVKPRDALKSAARAMYLEHNAIKEIVDALGVPERTVYQWRTAGKWDDLLSHEEPEEAAAKRFALLVARENKTPGELKELNALVGHMERLLKLKLARTRPREVWSGEGEVTDGSGPRKKRPSNKKPAKNDVSSLTAELFKEKVHPRLFGYQWDWNAQRHIRNRMLLKSRQIGFTYNEALMCFEDACLTGDNQIFLSATRAQANVFRDYIAECAAADFGITLTGNPLKLKVCNGKFANLYFLSNNSKSAQSYHGHVTIDEFFWITKFTELFNVATGMASHAKWRKTLLSTPSIITHPAHANWSGALYQKQFKNPKPWPSFKDLQGGVLCPDSWYRKIITIHDAIKGGCNLFDLKQLKAEYAAEVFRQLFECQFIDDAAAVFSFELLQNCMADPADWPGFKPKATRPVGDRPVWAGYDPARYRDDASFSVLLPPIRPAEPIRVLERHRWAGSSYMWQAARIRELADRYNIVHLGIDTTGPGIGVYEIVQQFLPFAMPINYSAGNMKSRLVLKAMEVMEQGRLEFDAADTGLAYAFLTIRQSSTESDNIIYKAARNATTGHADAAFSVMHALAAERLAHTSSGVIISVGA